MLRRRALCACLTAKGSARPVSPSRSRRCVCDRLISVFGPSRLTLTSAHWISDELFEHSAADQRAVRMHRTVQCRIHGCLRHISITNLPRPMGTPPPTKYQSRTSISGRPRPTGRSMRSPETSVLSALVVLAAYASPAMQDSRLQMLVENSVIFVGPATRLVRPPPSGVCGGVARTRRPESYRDSLIRRGETRGPIHLTDARSTSLLVDPPRRRPRSCRSAQFVTMKPTREHNVLPKGLC